MRPTFDACPIRFLDEKMHPALRYLPPHEREDLHRLACEDHADERGHEPTVRISVRVPISLAVRLDIERANTKRALRRRRATRSDTVRYLIERQLAAQDRDSTKRLCRT